MKRYPLRLQSVGKSAIWGGSKLTKEWNKIAEGGNTAESWELCVREDAMAMIRNGIGAGMSLRAYIEETGADCISPSYDLDNHFPLLVKLIDAADALSIQVHPDDDYAEWAEGDVGKTEMWYIVEAEEGAELLLGLQAGVNREDFAKAVREDRILDVVRHQPVKAGECYFIPAGMLHAIGGGILLVEIQQNSDLTYRVYDYDRRQADGCLRQLHTEKALDVTRPFSEKEINALCFARGSEIWGEAAAEEDRLLANCRYFSVQKWEIHGARTRFSDAQSFVHLLCIAGEGAIWFEGDFYPVVRGDSYWIPARMGAYTLTGNMTLIASSGPVEKNTPRGLS